MPRIDIKGYIVEDSDKYIYEWLGYTAVCPRDVSQAVERANGQDLEVFINSYGGSVWAGSEIYTILKDYNGNVTNKIVGLAASAASVVSQSAYCEMSPTAQMMIHPTQGGAYGDYREVGSASDSLKVSDQSIRNAYKLKTGLTDERLQELMDKTTWFSAQQALELKFIDKVMFTDNLPQLTNSFQPISREAIEKLRNTIKNPQNQNNGEADFLVKQAQARLNLLKLGGSK